MICVITLTSYDPDFYQPDFLDPLWRLYWH